MSLWRHVSNVLLGGMSLMSFWRYVSNVLLGVCLYCPFGGMSLLSFWRYVIFIVQKSLPLIFYNLIMFFQTYVLKAVYLRYLIYIKVDYL